MLQWFVDDNFDNKFADRFKTKSSRLKNWNYSSIGFYFVTICTYNKNNFFGKIIDNQMGLSKIGIITNQCLIDISKHFSNVILDEYIIMPNHIHLIIQIINNNVETPYMASLQTENKYKELNKKSNQLIPKAIQQFKSAVKRMCNQNKIWFSWQSRFYDHIVKNGKELLIIKNYISNNPINWQKDKFYIKN